MTVPVVFNTGAFPAERIGAIFKNVEAIYGSFSIVNADITGELVLPKLAELSGELNINHNNALISVALPALKAVGGKVNIYSNEKLARVDAGALVEVGSTWESNANPGLQSLDVSKLRSAMSFSVRTRACALHKHTALLQLAAFASRTCMRMCRVWVRVHVPIRPRASNIPANAHCAAFVAA